MISFKNEVYRDKLSFQAFYDKGELLINYCISNDEKALYKRYETLECIYRFMEGLTVLFCENTTDMYFDFNNNTLYIPRNNDAKVIATHHCSNIPEDIFHKLITPLSYNFPVKLSSDYYDFDLDFEKHDYYIGTEIELDVEEDKINDSSFLMGIVKNILKNFETEIGTEHFNNSGFEVRTPPTPREECYCKYGSLVPFMVSNGMVVGIDNDIHYHVDLSYLGDSDEEKKESIMKIIKVLVKFKDRIMPLRRYKTERLKKDCPFPSEVIDRFQIHNPTFEQMWTGCKSWAGCTIPIDRFWNGHRFSKTIEFRIFVIPNDEIEYIGQIDFIHCLMQVKNYSFDDLDNIEWEDLFSNKSSHLDSLINRCDNYEK